MEITVLGNCPSTLAPDPLGADADTVRAELEATAAAGFDAVSLWGFQAMPAADAVRASGLRVRAVEAAIGWSGGPSDAVTAEIDGLVGIAEEFGADIIGAACLGPVDDPGAAAAGLAAIAERAATAGMVVALEFIPWGGVPTLAAAAALCDDSGAANATVLLDTFHWVRQPGGPDLDALRSLPGERISYVQICDPAATALADVEAEAMTARRLPGTGVDYRRIWDALHEIGADPFVAAEVFSTELAATGMDTMARAVHDAGRAVLP